MCLTNADQMQTQPRSSVGVHVLLHTHVNYFLSSRSNSNIFTNHLMLPLTELDKCVSLKERRFFFAVCKHWHKVQNSVSIKNNVVFRSRPQRDANEVNCQSALGVNSALFRIQTETPSEARIRKTDSWLFFISLTRISPGRWLNEEFT